MSRPLSRRRFLARSAQAVVTTKLLSYAGPAWAVSPNEKLNIAAIGTANQARYDLDNVAHENIVALCDVDEVFLNQAGQTYTGAKKFLDYRRVLDLKGIDAVTVATPDHTHAIITAAALRSGRHVYCEKPLANTIEEARIVRANYLAKKNKLATQVGTQRHAFQNFNRVKELIRDGAIGELQAAYAWGNRQLRRPGYLPAVGTPPSTLNYDLWLGPSPFHPYNPGYFKGGPGMNCLEWNMYWDFGNGQVGDMGSHTMDLAWNAIDAAPPTAAEAKGEPFNPEVSPVELETHTEHPANSWRGPIRLGWYQGGALPKSPRDYIDLNKIGHGAMFKGTKGFLIAGFENRILIPYSDDADLTYFKPRKKAELLPPLGHFQKEWFNACKGNLKTSCDFDYAGQMIQQMLLGLVAYRAGQRIEWDAEAGRVTNLPEANQYLSKKYRDGWTLNG
jgi:predicted dehydrogenase